ncbi:YfiR family protein [Algibacillus agarilyticus]|uniref:YfiR family protein n=1 Tax=Algibacillus agarilyticus TaxID=2234133 RepID=UPI000DCF9EC3|nr:YfiR family protein [Algibacillus agarilyticus]
MDMVSPAQRALIYTLLATLFSVLLSAPVCAKSPDEATLRAAVVLGILRYTQWNEIDTQHNAINLCFMGGPMSEDVLTRASKKVAVKGKKIKIVEPQKTACNVIILGQNEFSQPLPEHSLIVCDNCEVKSGIAINLVKRNNRISFEIFSEQAKQNQISFGSALLELASRIY